MSHEIEAKIKVPGPELIIEKLKGLDCSFSHSTQQTDMYFMDANGRLKKEDCALRIRRQTTNGEHSALITFKGRRADGKFKNRDEYETAVENAETAEKIFESLGYHKKITVEKKRMIWLLDGCEVCLDELKPLGFFVEVEGPDETTITGVLEKLNLHNEPHITQSYASMIARTLKQE